MGGVIIVSYILSLMKKFAAILFTLAIAGSMCAQTLKTRIIEDGGTGACKAIGMDDYNRINHVPVFVANMDVGHGGTYMQPHGGEFAVVATAWYKWLLKGDDEAGSLFTGDPCGLSTSGVWTVAKKNLP